MIARIICANRGFLQLLGRIFISAALAAGLASCGMSPNDDGMGGVDVGVTDAAGDFLSYAVDVTSITLTKADGTVVQTLPQKTRIDFAQLVDVTELITGATVPVGDYVSATLLLDYGNADIEVDDGSGNPVKAVSVVDGQGNPVTTLSMTVKFDNAKHLVIAPGIPALFDLDFNLAASNSVNLTGPVVTVSPLLVADVNPDAPKPHRIRGPLDGVDTGAGTFTLILQPFNLRRGDHGRVTFFTDANTSFEIDQTTYVGNPGLMALFAKRRLTATVAIGTFDLANRHFVASEVLAGTSVPFGSDDVVTGNVLSRSGSVFVVKGAELVRSDGTLIFRDKVTVTVGAATKVRKQGTMGAFATGDISVGQRLSVFGTLTSATPGSTALDATGGLARLLVTQLNGVAGSAGSGEVVMNLARIDGRPIALFDFAGTGTGASPGGTDADPTAYKVATGALPLNSIANGTPLKVRGFVQPFGQATVSDDFNALTLTNTTNAPAILLVAWAPAQATPFTSYPSGGLTVNISGSFLDGVIRGGVGTVLAGNPTVNAPDPAHGLFVIGVDGMLRVYTQLAAYQAALQADLGAGKRARSFAAFGGIYDDPSNALSAGTMATALH